MDSLGQCLGREGHCGVWWGEHKGGSLAGDPGKVSLRRVDVARQAHRSHGVRSLCRPLIHGLCRSGAWPSMLGEEACIIILNSREVTV